VQHNLTTFESSRSF